jgi:Ca-activated chloride channel family protein
MTSTLRTLLATAALLASAPAVSHAQNVMFIVDFSGSMNEKVGGETKIAIAKQEFRNAVANISPNARVGLIAFGHRTKSCGDIEVMSKLGQRGGASLADRVDQLQASGETPIANALISGLAEFDHRKGESNSIVLITDGREECGGNPCFAASYIAQTGVNLKVNIIGLNQSPRDRQQSECITKATGGRYFDARNAAGLKAALGEVTAPKPIQVAAVAPVAAAPVVVPPPASTPVAQAPVPAPAPLPPPRKVIFADEFDGKALSESWEIVNARDDSYVVEGGKLTTISTTPGGLSNAKMPNVFKLNKELPDQDFTITAKLKIEFQTGQEQFAVGLFDDAQNYISAELTARASCCTSQAVEVHVRKMSGGESTGFTREVFHVPGNSIGGDFKRDVNAVAQPITLKLIKEGRRYRAAVNFAGQKDASGKPIWIETEAVQSLRPPKAVVLNGSQLGAVTGETAYDIDAITIDVPGQ